MAQQKREQKNITSATLLVVQRNENKERGRATEIRVVDWIVDGSKHYPQLEKRELFTDEQGEWKLGKAKGFTRNDLNVVQDQWGEIMAALGSTLPEDQRKPATATAPTAAAAPPAPQTQEDF